MTNDKFGIKQINETVAGGDTWFMGDRPVTNDPRLIFPGIVSSLIARPNGMFTPNTNSNVIIAVLPIAGYIRPPGGCGMDFDAAEGRGYTGSINSWGSVEVTAMLKAQTITQNANPIKILGPTDENQGGNCCMAKGYFQNLGLGDPVDSQMLKQMFNGSTFSRTKKILRDSFGASYDLALNELLVRPDINTFGGIFGLKYIHKLNQGTDGLFVKTEMWINISGNKQTWVKVNETTDSGSWGNTGNVCSGSPSQIFNFKAGSMTIGWNQPGGEIQIGMMSVRAIVDGSSGSGPSTPPLPQPGTLQFTRIIDIKYHLGLLAAGTCGFGTPGLVTYITIPRASGDESNLHADRYRVGEIAAQLASDMIGHQPRQITVHLSRTGSPPDEEVSVCVRKGLDDSIAVSYDLIAIDGTPTAGPLTAMDLTTDFKEYTFENADAEYAMLRNDIISVEYSGNTEDTTNEVNVGRNDGNPYDGGNSAFRRFDVITDPEGTAPDTWGTIETGIDLAMTVKE